MTTALAEKLYTPAEYLALERAAEYKNEYYDGRIYAMSGARRAHNLIEVNIAGDLSRQLRDRPCEVYGGHMRVRMPVGAAYVYADVTVACGDIQFEDDELDTLLNPLVIFEILSKSTESHDRGDKFARYRRIPSLQEYVLVSQRGPYIEVYRRSNGDNEWTLTEVDGLERVLELQSIGCRLALTDVYHKVRFPAEQPLHLDGGPR